MKNTLLLAILSICTFSSIASQFDSRELQSPAPSLKEFDGKWVMTKSFCSNDRDKDLSVWSSSFLKINDGVVESRVSGPDCIFLENLIYTEGQSIGDVLVYNEAHAQHISKFCLDEENSFFKRSGEGIKSAKSKLYIDKNNLNQIYQVMDDLNCGGNKGVTVIYSRL